MHFLLPLHGEIFDWLQNVSLVYCNPDRQWYAVWIQQRWQQLKCSRWPCQATEIVVERMKSQWSNGTHGGGIHYRANSNFNPGLLYVHTRESESKCSSRPTVCMALYTPIRWRRMIGKLRDVTDRRRGTTQIPHLAITDAQPSAPIATCSANGWGITFYFCADNLQYRSNISSRSLLSSIRFGANTV